MPNLLRFLFSFKKKSYLYMWNIHGKTYNLNSYMDKHPGGKAILKSCMGNDDLTATFESYHAFCDMEKIKTIMKKYEISDCESSKMLFKTTGFYKTIQARVKNELMLDTKANRYWILKIIVQNSIFIGSFYFAFFAHWLGIIYRILSAIISGHMLIQVGFCAMHDASHMAITKKKYINEFISNIWNAIALWDSQLWSYHHVIRHHTFTGDINKDPDTIHFKPFIRKSREIPINGYLNISKQYPILIALVTICIIPGMFIGQGIIYNIIWLKKGFLWKMKLPKTFKFSILQSMIKLFMLCSFVYGRNISIFFAYAFSQNITYAICILPDHDTFETNQNHIKYDNNKDWGELQVRHSASFCTQNMWVCYLFGGINYQIEHHLFPTLCHIHFHKIKPIVEKTCKEFEIPYVHHYSLRDAIWSTLKQYSYSSIM